MRGAQVSQSQLMQATISRIESHLSAIARRYPDAWRLMDLFRAERKSLGDWPHWCFAPLAASYAIVSGGGNNRVIPDGSDSLVDISRIGALAAWRITKGIYHFYELLFQKVSATPLKGELPVSLLHHLPEWCVYIPTPGMKCFDYRLHGFFAHIEYDVNDGHSELRLLFDTDESRPPFSPVGIELPTGLIPFPIHLRPDGLTRSLGESFQYAKQQADRLGFHEMAGIIAMTPKNIAEACDEVAPFINLVLYLCSVGADIRTGGDRRPAFPVAKKTKKGLRLFPKDKPTIWETGFRIGAALRAAEGETRSEEKGGTHASPRPHIRVAHWHSFWAGPMKEPEKRRLLLKWLPPIPVGMGEILPTVKTVVPKA